MHGPEDHRERHHEARDGEAGHHDGVHHLAQSASVAGHQVGDGKHYDRGDQGGQHADPDGVPGRTQHVVPVESQGHPALAGTQEAEQAPVGQRHRRGHKGQPDHRAGGGQCRSGPSTQRNRQGAPISHGVQPCSPSSTGARHGAFRCDHQEGQDQEQQGQGERPVTVEQSGPEDRLGERLEAHQVDGAEVRDRVEEHEE